MSELERDIDAAIRCIQAREASSGDEAQDPHADVSAAVASIRAHDLAQVEARMHALVGDARWAARALVPEVLRWLKPASAEGRPERAREHGQFLVEIAEQETDARVLTHVIAAFQDLLHDVGDALVMSALRSHVSSTDSAVRGAVAAVLFGMRVSAAVDVLVTLSRDEDPYTRNWATFDLASGLGDRLTPDDPPIDSPAIRDALAARLTDADPETRGDAMIGLANRGDARVLPALRAALIDGEPFWLMVGAIERWPAFEHIAALQKLAASSAPDHADELMRVIALCRAS